jgi:hypothetical protein
MTGGVASGCAGMGAISGGGRQNLGLVGQDAESDDTPKNSPGGHARIHGRT